MIKYLSDANGYKILPVKTGMQVELHERVGEGSTERIWKFKGLIIKVRKSKLYYIREKVGKAARMKSKIAAERRESDLLK